MLAVDSLTVSHGPVAALRGVSFSAARGAITAVLGANGAGKTTLLRTVSGLHRAGAGSITLDGQPIDRLPAEAMVALGLAHVPEGRGVITELSVEENLRLGGLGRGSVRPGDLDLAYDLFGVLAERKNQLAGTLSGGERQMLVIGRALMARPEILLLDEPSLGLAPRVVAQIFALLRRLVVDQGLSVLLVEQNAISALSVADRGVVLHLGRVVADEEASRLAADDQLRHAYLGF